MTGRCAQTDTHTSNEHIISAIHFVHLAEIIRFLRCRQWFVFSHFMLEALKLGLLDFN